MKKLNGYIEKIDKSVLNRIMSSPLDDIWVFETENYDLVPFIGTIPVISDKWCGGATKKILGLVSPGCNIHYISFNELKKIENKYGDCDWAIILPNFPWPHKWQGEYILYEGHGLCKADQLL